MLVDMSLDRSQLVYESPREVSQLSLGFLFRSIFKGGILHVRISDTGFRITSLSTQRRDYYTTIGPNQTLVVDFEGRDWYGKYTVLSGGSREVKGRLALEHKRRSVRSWIFSHAKLHDR
ncbi:hypothetical protein TNCV_3641611 [Trichonephila clavipes]|nr:hypothetical protein TNCV_3641611 [Trichonephila clavipes]